MFFRHSKTASTEQIAQDLIYSCRKSPQSPAQTQGLSTFFRQQETSTEQIAQDLRDACRERPQALARIQALIAQDPGAVKVADKKKGYLALHYACCSTASLEVIQELLRVWPESVMAATKKGNLPLHWACRYKAPLLVVQELVWRWPESAKVADKNGDLPLHKACEVGSPLVVEVIRFLASVAPDTIATTNHDGVFPLAIVRRSKRSNIVALLQEILEPNREIQRISKALRAACEEQPQSLGRIQALIAKGPEAVKVDGWDGYLPLHWACRYKAPLEVIQELVRAWPESVKATSKYGYLPLHVACAFEAPLEVIQELVRARPDTVEFKSKRGGFHYTPLDIAKRKNRKDAVAVLRNAMRRRQERLKLRSVWQRIEEQELGKTDIIDQPREHLQRETVALLQNASERRMQKETAKLETAKGARCLQQHVATKGRATKVMKTRVCVQRETTKLESKGMRLRQKNAEIKCRATNVLKTRVRVQRDPDAPLYSELPLEEEYSRQATGLALASSRQAYHEVAAARPASEVVASNDSVVGMEVSCADMSEQSDLVSDFGVASSFAETFTLDLGGSKAHLMYRHAVVLVVVVDASYNMVAAGSGFIVDASMGLIVTASHIFFHMDAACMDDQFGTLKGSTQAAIGIIPEGEKSARFRYMAGLVAQDIDKVDAFVLRITHRFESDFFDHVGMNRLCSAIELSGMRNERLQYLEMREGESVPGEPVRIVGFDQDGKSLDLKLGKHVCPAVQVASGRVSGLVKAADCIRLGNNNNNPAPRFCPVFAELVVEGCSTNNGQSGGPCINSDGTVVGILSRGYAERSYLVPVNEIESLLVDLGAIDAVPHNAV